VRWGRWDDVLSVSAGFSVGAGHASVMGKGDMHFMTDWLGPVAFSNGLDWTVTNEQGLLYGVGHRHFVGGLSWPFCFGGEGHDLAPRGMILTHPPLFLFPCFPDVVHT